MNSSKVDRLWQGWQDLEVDFVGFRVTKDAARVHQVNAGMSDRTISFERDYLKMGQTRNLKINFLPPSGNGMKKLKFCN